MSSELNQEEEYQEDQPFPTNGIPYGVSPPIPRDQWNVIYANANQDQVPKAYDGVRNTRWYTATGSPNTTPLPRQFVLDLGKSYIIDRMILDNDWQGIGEYSVALSDDPDQLTHRVIISLMTNNSPAAFVFLPPLEGRFFLLEVLKPYTKPGATPGNYSYLSELQLEGIEKPIAPPITERCEGEPITINWTYSTTDAVKIYSFVLLKREETNSPIIEKVYIRKDQRTITFPAHFGPTPDWLYFSMITTGQNENGSVWESAESNLLTVKYDPTRPYCAGSDAQIGLPPADVEIP